MTDSTDTTKLSIIRIVQNLPSEWDLPPEWKMSFKGREALKVAVGMSNTRHGLFASVPIVCREHTCPYAETCGILEYGLAPMGERCPVEIAEAMRIYDGYVRELSIDMDSMVDLGLLKELVDIEVTIIRADKLLAQDGSPIQEVTAGVTPQGRAITRPEIHKAVEIKDKVNKRKHEILRLLNATRRDKKEDNLMDPSTYAAELIKKAERIQKGLPLDAQFEVIEDSSG